MTIDLPPATPLRNTAGANQAAALPPLPSPAPVPAPKVKPAPAAPRERPAAKEPKPAATPSEEAPIPEPGPPESNATRASEAPVLRREPNTEPGPLPRPVMASTIRRIGYRCPTVSSVERESGEAVGAEASYKVTCSSGDTYRARGKGGHVRFRRTGARP